MKNPKNKGYHCWVTNIGKTDVRLSDLGVTVRSKKTIDLLDCYHSYLTVEQVKKSIESGSLKKRLNQKPKVIFLRQSEPEPPIPRQIEVSKMSFPSRHRSIIQHVEPVFEELEISLEEEEQFAEDMAETAIEEHAAMIQLHKDTEENENE